MRYSTISSLITLPRCLTTQSRRASRLPDRRPQARRRPVSLRGRHGVDERLQHFLNGPGTLRFVQAQLRGRVVRSNHQAYCFVCPESRGEPTVARLKALVTAKSGFELAEQDLLQRGPGELSGRKQWGISDIGMEALRNLKLVEAARTEAQALLKQDGALLKHPMLAQLITERSQQTHFE